MLAWDRTCVVKKGLRDRNSPTCTLSQNGYGDTVVWLLDPGNDRLHVKERSTVEKSKDVGGVENQREKTGRQNERRPIGVGKAPTVGLEPTTTRLRALRSAD